MVATQDLEVVQGDTLTQPFSVPLDLTGWTVTGQVRHKASDPTKEADFTVTIDDAANGDFTVSLTPAETAAMLPQDYRYDVQIDDGTDVHTLVRGPLTVIAEVTR